MARLSASLLLLASLLAVVAAPPARAQTPPDTSTWRCRLCRFEPGTEAEFTTGSTYVSDDAARFGDATGYDREGAYVIADSDGRFVNDRQRIVWHAEDLGLDARSLGLDGSVGGTIGYRMRYRQLPHYLFDTTATVFRRASPGSLVLPAGWTRAPVTSQMTGLTASLLPRDIASRREGLDLGLRLNPGESLRVYVDYGREEQTGTTLTGASFFNTASQLARPLDRYTDNLAAGIRYLMGRGSLDFGYHGSFFDNRLSALSWEDPFTSPVANARGRLATAPDNSYQNLSVAGAFHFAANTALTFAAGVGHGEQNEPLLAYTTNTGPVVSALPRATLAGSVDTSHVAITVRSRPWTRLRIRSAWRYDERDNQTPIDVWNRVITDLFNTVESERNVAYDFKRSRFELSADANVTKRLGLSAGYDYVSRDRYGQEVTAQTENGGWGRLRWRIRPGFELSVKHGTERRDIDRYDTLLAAELLQNPLLAKYNLAYRFRTYADLMFSASGSTRPYTLAVSARRADDDYSRSRLGLTNDDDQRLAVDFGWTFSPHVAFFTSLSNQTIDARQRGSEAFAGPDWSGHTRDRFSTFTGGVTLDEVLPRLDLSIDFSTTDGTTGIAVDAAAGDEPFPDLSSKLDALHLKAVFRQSARVDVLIELRYEHLATEDWALANVGPATIPGLLALGADPFNYRIAAVGAGVTYRWGRDHSPSGR